VGRLNEGDSRSVTGKQELILLERKLVLGTAGWGIIWRNQVPPPESLLVKGESCWLRIQPVNRVLPLTPTFVANFLADLVGIVLERFRYSMDVNEAQKLLYVDTRIFLA
jgi:hypothetical protein